MHTSAALALLAAAGVLTQARPIPKALLRREVPQEHSHEKFLTSVRASLLLDNPDAISDPVFGLLGNAAASKGQGQISDTDCLQQATADQAFTNAKAAGDVDGMVNALVYRALERNTGKVGLASVACTAIKAKNPEIAAITQHQDPASAGAAAANKAITLELAKQIASVGGDPQIALQSGTFSPGNPNDNTGKGNTCDDTDDAEGCIFTKNLLVEDATAAEIDAAAGGQATAGEAGKAKGAAKAGKGNKTGAENAGAANDAGNASVSASVGDATAEAVADATNSAVFQDAASSTADPNASSTSSADTAQATDASADAACSPAVTVTVTAGAADAAATASAPAPPVKAPKPAAGGDAASAPVNNAAATAGGASSIHEAATLTSNVDLGDCPNTAMAFGVGIEGRKETSFVPANTQQFAHGSAQNPNIITQFMCDNLVNKCGLAAGSEGVATCKQAEDAVADADRTGATADLWNSFFGITTNFASVPVVDNQGRLVASNGAGSAAAAPADNASADKGSSASTPAKAAGKTGDSAAGSIGSNAGQDTADTSNNAAAAASGSNVNNFTGSLGSAPVAVQNVGGDRPFKVVNDTFVNSGAALGRACDVQHNKCANAANSNKALGISASDCDTQNAQCHAVNGV